MRKDDAIRLRHMLDAAREAMSFAQGRTRGDLDNDRQLVLALVKDIEIVGEAATRITEPTRLRLREIPWDRITGPLVHRFRRFDEPGPPARDRSGQPKVPSRPG